MNRATLISRVVFGLLVLATFTAFFVAQRLKRTEPLVYAVQMKKYISPNDDRERDRGYLRFRLKETDVVSVEVIDRAQRVVRTLADERELKPGPHRFYWNGRRRSGGRKAGDPVPDGAYRVRVSLRNVGRTFVPDKFFVVDTRPPVLTAIVAGEHTVSALRGRPDAVTIELAGASQSRRAEIDVYAVRGARASLRPVATFMAQRGQTTGEWNLMTGEFQRRDEKARCFGGLVTTGRARPAPPGRYVFVARVCDAAGNQGISGGRVPPRRGDGPRAGLTLRGFEVQPALSPVRPGGVLSLAVNPPPGGYRWRLRRVGGDTQANGSARGSRLSLRVPADASEGLYTLDLLARRPAAGGRSAAAPLVVGGRYAVRDLLVVYPAISWQAQNAVDTDGDGFADDFASAVGQQRAAAGRTLAGGALPPGFSAREAAFQRQLDAAPPRARVRATTDLALALDPQTQLGRARAVIFAGDERWITPQLGPALKRFVHDGGRVAFFAPDAFRRTVRLTAGSISGPSQRAERDVFGESIDTTVSAEAPVVPFVDQLGLLPGATGSFTTFEESRSRARAAQILTSAGRRPGRPVLVAYALGDGLVIRVGAAGWQAALADDAGVRSATGRIVEELLK